MATRLGTKWAITILHYSVLYGGQNGNILSTVLAKRSNYKILFNANKIKYSQQVNKQ